MTGTFTTIRKTTTRRESDMARRAVCVGINEFATLPMSSWLSGCVNDAHDIAAALRTYGFTGAATTVLCDADATKPAVMGALTTMVESAEPGDHLVFSFSSHGTQVPNEPGGDDEPDGLDEAFACYEIARSGDQWSRDTVIVDDELHDLFGGVPKGVLLEVILDTCHSGTGLKDLDDVMQAALLGRRPRYLPPPTVKGLSQVRDIRSNTAPRTVDRKALVELTKSRGRATGKPVLYAACRPEQTASDATFEGRSNGAFTYHLLGALHERPDSSRSELHTAVTARLKRGDFDQRSTLEGPAAARKVGFGQLW